MSGFDPREQRRYSGKRTDNEQAGIKIALRLALVDALKKDTLRVVDAYAGTGFLWKQVQAARPHVRLHMTAIEQKRNGRLDIINGDNLRVLPSLPLADYDIIDLDAYGAPTKQLAIVAQAAPHVPVLITCATSKVGLVAYDLLATAGIPPEWERDVIKVFRELGTVNLWDGYTATLGYTRRIGYTTHTNNFTKRYDVLLTPDAPATLRRKGAWAHL